MLIGVTLATTKMTASATSTAAPPTTSGTPAATTEPNTSSRARAGERQRDDLAPAEVGLGDRLDVAVERGAAREPATVSPATCGGAAADRRQRVGRVVGRQVEEDDVVRGVAVGRDLARRQQVRHDARDVRRGRDVADGIGRGGLELGRRRP